MPAKPARRARKGSADPARRAAYRALREVTGRGAYANLALGEVLAKTGLTGRDAGFVTELVNGTCRLLGSYDAIIGAASGRDPERLDAGLRDVLRLGAHQALSMRVPDHAGVAASVELARTELGERVTGLVNAVMRKLTARELAEWTALLAEGQDQTGALAVITHHPRWIVEAYQRALPADRVEPALRANNEPPRTWLAVRPGLAGVEELIGAGAEASALSPVGASWPGDPATAPGVADGRVGVQDPGSQLVTLALAGSGAAPGPWLDLCAGPGGKTALLTGLAARSGQRVLAVERQPHRARLVRQAVRGYPGPATVVVADGLRPAWAPGTFGLVLADVPCTGLGSLRRRPESRWRRDSSALAELRPLQEGLLVAAIEAAAPGGVIGYVTCSPHPAETSEVVRAVLAKNREVSLERIEIPGVPQASTEAGWAQLWPHRDGTDAMFVALLRKH